MLSSLKGNVVNPDALIEGLAVGMANRGVVGEGQSRAMTAISQMASKGVVSMEELRQQLGKLYRVHWVSPPMQWVLLQVNLSRWLVTVN